MTDQVIQGTNLRAEDKIDKLREQIHINEFKENDEIRQFINRYVSANPDNFSGKSVSLLDELVGNIRSELGLEPAAQGGVTKIISDHVRDLIRGRAQASEDTAHWAVHHAANQVTMYSGQFVYDADDIFIDGAGMDFLFHRTYKSQGYNKGPLGINWDHNYNLWLRKVDDEKKFTRLTGGFQESKYIRHDLYDQAGFNYWVPPPGEHSIIFDVLHAGQFSVEMPATCQDCDYGMRLPNGTVYYYAQDPGIPTHYYVKCIVDRFGNYLEFNYDQDPGELGSRLKEVLINNPHRKVVFEYDSEGRIVSIKDYMDRVWHYTYDDYGDLIAFTTPGTDRYPEGLTERYVYSTPYYSGELQHKLVQVYDTAGRMYLENEYGTDKGLLSFNRVVRQREGKGERFFEYEDISLATGLPAGQPEIEEDMPAYQTVMARRNGHPIHYIYNKFGNLIAREEDAWADGMQRHLVTHYRYNRDGALIGEISPEGRITQYLYGRDEYVRYHHAEDLTEDQLWNLTKLKWNECLSFGNRLAKVQRGDKLKGFFSFQFPSPLSKLKLEAVNAYQDMIIKFSYDDKYQNLTSISHPMYTKSPFPNAVVDNNKEFEATLTNLVYDLVSGKLLEKIKYPDCTRDGQPEIQNIEENFLSYDQNGRLTEYSDRAETLFELSYFPAPANSNDPDALKEGYLHKQTIDPNGLNLKTEYQINEVGVVTQVITPKNQVIGFEVDSLNRVTTVTVTLNPKYLFCWEEIPGNDSERLTDFLKLKYDAEWVKMAKIAKTHNGKTIMISAGKNFISLNLNDENTELILKIDNGETNKLIVKAEKGKLNIYKPSIDYQTRYAYCRNMRVERIERDVQDDEGHPLWGGTEVQFFHYDENDNVSRQQIGSLDFKDHLVTRYTYDDGDLRVRTTLPRGNSIRIDYDERRLPRKITRGVGSKEAVTIKVIYDGDGLITKHRDGRGLKTKFVYDSFGRVTKTEDYDEQDKLYRLIRQDYDKAGNLTQERVFIPENNGFKLLSHNQYIYNELNQPIEVRVRRFQIPIAYSVAEIDKVEDKYLFSWDEIPGNDSGLLIYFLEQNFSIDWAITAKIEKIDNNKTIKISMAKNFLLLKLNKEKTKMKLEIDDFRTYEFNARTENNKLNIYDDNIPLGEAVRTLYYYDKAGRLTSVEQHGKRLDAWGNPEPIDTILASTYAYNSVGWLISEKDALGNETMTSYDKHGLVTRTDICEKVADSPTGLEVFTTLYEYDNLDQLKSITDGLGNVTFFNYDSRNAVIRKVDPLGNVIHFDYDIYGRKVAERIEMTDTGIGGGPHSPGSDIITHYEYDANGNLVRLIDAHGTPIDQAYDALDRRVELKYAKGTATTNRYDGNDNVVWMQDNNGLIKLTTFNTLDRPVEMRVDKRELKAGCAVEGATCEVFEYDALGQMTRARAEDKRAKWWCDIRFKVDSLGRAYEESTQFSDLAQTFTLKRQYDDFGFLRRLTYPNGRILLYHPDVLNRIQRIDNQAYGAYYPGNTNLPPQRMILENQYRGLRIGRKLFGNGAVTAYAYDGAGRGVGITHTSTQGANLLTLQHLYDAAGNMRFKHEYASGQRNYGEVYRYDSRYQLTHYQAIVPPNQFNLATFAPAQAVPPEPPQFTGQTQINQCIGNLAQIQNVFTYQYDKLGNRLEDCMPNSQPINYISNSLNQYTQRDGTQYSYDHNGNLRLEKVLRPEKHVTIGHREYIYNHWNQICRVIEEGADMSLRHDVLRRCVWSHIEGMETYYLYDNENVVEERQHLKPQQPSQPFMQYANEFGIDSRCQLIVNACEYWYHKDLVGSTREITNINQTLVAFYFYTPFGHLVTPLPVLTNVYLFAGRRFFPSLSLYCLRARSYSPQLGRFLQRDTANIWIESNPYLYAHNSPLTKVDPLGCQDEVKVAKGYYKHPSGYILREGEELSEYLQREKLQETRFGGTQSRNQFFAEIKKEAAEVAPFWDKAHKIVSGLMVFAVLPMLAGAGPVYVGSATTWFDIGFMAKQFVESRVAAEPTGDHGYKLQIAVRGIVAKTKAERFAEHVERAYRIAISKYVNEGKYNPQRIGQLAEKDVLQSSVPRILRNLGMNPNSVEVGDVKIGASGPKGGQHTVEMVSRQYNFMIELKKSPQAVRPIQAEAQELIAREGIGSSSTSWRFFRIYGQGPKLFK